MPVEVRKSPFHLYIYSASVYRGPMNWTLGTYQGQSFRQQLAGLGSSVTVVCGEGKGTKAGRAWEMVPKAGTAGLRKGVGGAWSQERARGLRWVPGASRGCGWCGNR